MSTTHGSVALIGAGAAACAVCCAAPILGLLAAIGLGTVAGVLTFGAAGLVVGALGLMMVVLKRRPRPCPAGNSPVLVDAPTVRAPR